MAVACLVLTWNSMGSSEIWDKYSTTRVVGISLPCEICPISNTTLMVFIPNFTATHAITYTNSTGSVQYFHNFKTYRKLYSDEANAMFASLTLISACLLIST